MNKDISIKQALCYDKYMQELSKTECFDALLDLFQEGQGLKALYFAVNWEAKYGVKFSTWVKSEPTLSRLEKRAILDYYSFANLH